LYIKEHDATVIVNARQIMGLGDKHGQYGGLASIVNPQALDHQLSNQLERMSFEDRENIQDEIHGVKSLAPEETPERINESLLLLDFQIKKLLLTMNIDLDSVHEETIRVRNQVLLGTSTDLGQVMQYSYILEADFRLRFLRAELFDIGKAATRYLNNLDYLVENFGPIGLQRPLRIFDLDPIERIILRSGGIQLVPTRDRRGRRIMNIVGVCGEGYPNVHKFRVFQYLLDALSEDVETQKHGLLLIFWAVPEMAPYHKDYVPTPDMDGERRGSGKLFASTPVRISAVHFCNPDNAFFRFVNAVVIACMAMDQRVRVRTHCGNIMECRYWLITFGIPVEDLPVTDMGNFKCKNLQQWIKGREMIDLLDRGDISRKYLIECPNLQDVLFSNGGNRWTFPGNVAFREILECKGQSYSKKSSAEKVATIEAVIQEVRGMNGRFLVWERVKGCWIVMDRDPKALKLRVGAALRDHMRRIVTSDSHKQTVKSDTAQFLSGRALKRQKCGSHDCTGGFLCL
jgi:hypothetical protein